MMSENYLSQNLLIIFLKENKMIAIFILHSILRLKSGKEFGVSLKEIGNLKLVTKVSFSLKVNGKAVRGIKATEPNRDHSKRILLNGEKAKRTNIMILCINKI